MSDYDTRHLDGPANPGFSCRMCGRGFDFGDCSCDSKPDAPDTLQVRLHTVDSTTGEDTVEDLTITGLNAQAIAEALTAHILATSGEEFPVTGLSLHMAPGGRHGAWVGQFDAGCDQTLMAGIVYLDFI